MSEKQCKHLTDPKLKGSPLQLEAATLLVAPTVGGPLVIEPGVFNGVRLCCYCLGVVHGTLLKCVGR